MIPPRLLRGGLVAALGLTMLAPAALADDYCVGRTGCTVPNTFAATGAGLQAALASADASPAGDRVLVGAGTYARTTGGFSESGTSTGGLQLIGAGSQATILTAGDASTPVLSVSPSAGGTVEVIDLGIVMPGFAGAQGLVSSGGGSVAAARIRVTDSPGASATVGVAVNRGTTHLQSSLVVLEGGGNGRALLAATGSADSTIVADSVTLVGDGTGGQEAVAAQAGTAHTATIDLTNAVIRGFPHTLTANASNVAGTATVDASWSDYDATQNLDSNGSGTDSFTQANNRDGTQDPGFVKPSGGDYRLRFDSPLIDRGDPFATAGIDLASKPLLVDGDLSGGPRRDMGAFEYQREAPTDIAVSPATVAENQPAGTTVGTLGATDPTADDTAIFSLVSGAGADDNTAFTLAGSELRTTRSFDLEQKPSYSVRVRVVDSAGETFEKPLAIAVGNVNEPPTGITLSAFFVAEGKPVGTAVARLAAVDVDAGDPHTFSLVAGAGAADNGAFAIAGGVLRTATSFNAKQQPSYSIRVRTVDSGAIPEAVEKQFTLTVADSTRPNGSIVRTSRQTVRSVLARGLRATVVVTEPSTAAFTVLLNPATRARTSRLLASLAFSIPRKLRATVTFRLSPKARKLLRRARRPRLTASVLLTDRAGNQRRIARRFSLRR